ncbi:hypothetical protein DVZ84_07790 [Streptomyces parvulus]|uniref:Uncharacterized protein n=1 Tax=Streptomyces parvulus TaxID=146923 RepID=A0A369VAV5_9ACTN|nr:hypothetical protein DVZ84_07790 [Streptomyces parvulus]
MLGDVLHRSVRTAPCSQPLFRFRGATSVGRPRPGVIPADDGDPDVRSVAQVSRGRRHNRAGALVDTVKSRHSACAAGCRT